MFKEIYEKNEYVVFYENTEYVLAIDNVISESVLGIVADKSQEYFVEYNKRGKREPLCQHEIESNKWYKSCGVGQYIDKLTRGANAEELGRNITDKDIISIIHKVFPAVMKAIKHKDIKEYNTPYNEVQERDSAKVPYKDRENRIQVRSLDDKISIAFAIDRHTTEPRKIISVMSAIGKAENYQPTNDTTIGFKIEDGKVSREKIIKDDNSRKEIYRTKNKYRGRDY